MPTRPPSRTCRLNPSCNSNNNAKNNRTRSRISNRRYTSTSRWRKCSSSSTSCATKVTKLIMALSFALCAILFVALPLPGFSFAESTQNIFARTSQFASESSASLHPVDPDVTEAIRILDLLDNSLSHLNTIGYSALRKLLPNDFCFFANCDSTGSALSEVVPQIATNDLPAELLTPPEKPVGWDKPVSVLQRSRSIHKFPEIFIPKSVNLFNGLLPLSVPKLMSKFIARAPSSISEILIGSLRHRALATQYALDVRHALFLLRRAWVRGSDPRAARYLADFFFYGNYSIPMRPSASFQLYRNLTKTSAADPAVHYNLALFYSTNFGHAVVPKHEIRTPKGSEYYTAEETLQFSDQAHTQLHLLMAAAGGHAGAEMSLGYRFANGIGVERSCSSSNAFYRRVAERVIKHYRDGPPGGRTLPQSAARLYESNKGSSGGFYGPGAKPGSLASRARASGEVLSEEETLEYYKYMAEGGDAQAQYVLALSYYHGGKLVSRHYGRALRYFSMAASQGAFSSTDPTKNEFDDDEDEEDAKKKGGKEKKKKSSQTDMIAAHSSAYIGLMYLRGEAVPQNNATATTWFQRAAKFREAMATSYLAIMLIDKVLATGAITSPEVLHSALISLKSAAAAGRVEAQVYMGNYHYGRKEYREAASYFASAMNAGNVLAIFTLGDMYSKGLVVQRSCLFALHLYRIVAEKGIEWLIPSATLAQKSIAYNEQFGALMYMMSAERGSESAQSNLAWLLGERMPLDSRQAKPPSSSLLDLPIQAVKSLAQSQKKQVGETDIVDSYLTSVSPPGYLDQSHVDKRDPLPRYDDLFARGLELVYLVRAGIQHNGLARVRAGDLYYYGADGVVSKDLERAVAFYRAAADTEQAPLAMWNLGYMYHHGLGVPADEHLAKRYYDRSLETNPDAWLPVTLSLWHLRATTWLSNMQKHFSSDVTSEKGDYSSKKYEEMHDQVAKDASLNENLQNKKHSQPPRRKKSRLFSSITKFFNKILGTSKPAKVGSLGSVSYPVRETGNQTDTTSVAILCALIAILVYIRQVRLQPPPVPETPQNVQNHRRFWQQNQQRQNRIHQQRQSTNNQNQQEQPR